MNSTKYHLHLFPTRDASPPLELAFLQATNTSAKRYHKTLTQTLLQNANSNGGDASSRRDLRQRLTDRSVISAICESLFIFPTRDASPPLEVALVIAFDA